MFFDQMPAAWAHEQGRNRVVELVLLAAVLAELDRAGNRAAKVGLTFHRILPCRRVRILEVRHEDLRAGIERVDDHLALNWTRDFRAPILKICRYGGYRP